MSRSYSEEDCIEALRDAKQILGESPTTRQYRELDIKPSIGVIWDKFDSWNQAKEAAGLNTNKTTSLERSDEVPEIINMSEEEWKSIDKNLRFRRRNQAEVAKKKMERGCKVCGYDENPVALEWHHKHSENKFSDISTMISQGYSIERIENEIEKCIVLCSNCHKVETSGNIYDLD